MTKREQALAIEVLMKVREEVINLYKAYPLDIFPEPEPGCSPDRYSASMARHMCRMIIGKINQIGIDYDYTETSEREGEGESV